MSFFRSFSQVLQSSKADASAEETKSSSRSSSKNSKKSRNSRRRDRSADKREDQSKSAKKGSYLQKSKQKQKSRTEQNKAQQAEARQQEYREQQQMKQKLADAEKEAERIVQEAQGKSREILLEAKSEALQIREAAERDVKQELEKIEQQQKNLDRQISSINDRLKQVDKREDLLDQKRDELEKKQTELEAKRTELIDELENIGSLTRDEARQEILKRLERTVDKQAALMIQQKMEAAEQEADEKAKEFLVDAMKHGATDYVPEFTISVVKLPDADMKGRIIGKDGRNIRAFERSTGVDVELDETPNEVRLSCFDPVRREIARISLERLLKDGRIQPTRIDEVVKKVTKELEKIMFEEGKRLCHKVGIYNMPNEIMGRLGRFKYRFSYGQNLIQHTLEETQIGIKLANELGLDVRTVTMGCLLHDIGKVIEGEGNHVELGVRYLQKNNFPQEVIDCVAQHHEDEPFTSLESVLVYISDAISGSRPGARNENHEEYVQRLQKLEEIADSYEGVEKSFAIQAGREVRVILKADKSSDRDVNVIATQIAARYEEDMTYPGTVTVNVIREVRGSAVAK
ncbi:ribonuclease Y [Candidatus Woesebacteria bacterium]|nr:ribonuclease Y [Candidatus Woesebacteria bacterium]MCD8507144.1 ribonuclease Y [Candidatus Woesebacteria bacterium]MCD8527184.1 ribonuclease Y [Candidatus Woesebacteria bacterium]